MSTKKQTSKNTPSSRKGSDEPDSKSKMSDYDHPYKLDKSKSDETDSYYEKRMAKTLGTTFCSSRIAESNGASFSVSDPVVSTMCHSFNGRIVKILSDKSNQKNERLGEVAANVITLSTCKYIDDIMRVLAETAVSDSIKEGSAAQKSKVIKHWNITSILKNHPAMRKYGLKLLDKLQTRVKVPEKSTQAKMLASKRSKETKSEQKKDLKKTLPKGKGAVKKNKS